MEVYLGSIGGAAAKLALGSIKHIEILEYAELVMEAIWKIEVENFPAFIVIDDKGNDFYNRGFDKIKICFYRPLLWFTIS